MQAALREDWAIFRLALQFMTRLPVPTDGAYSAERMALTPRWYGGVGAFIGLICAVVYVLAAHIWPPMVAAALAVITGLLVTGGLHEDGLADTFDGLGGGRTKDRVLEIMRDSRIGSYGAIALMATLGLRVMVLAALPPHAVPFALVAGHAISRAGIVAVMARADYLRATGAGSAVAARPTGLTLAYATITALVAAALLLWPFPLTSVFAALVCATLGHLALSRWFLGRLGGYTGDCLGAVQQTTEIAIYLGLLAWA